MGKKLISLIAGIGLFLGVVKTNGQDFPQNPHPWKYSPKMSISVDLNNDGIEDRFSAVDSSSLKSKRYDYRLIAEYINQKNEVDSAKEIGRTSGMVFNLSATDNSLYYEVNQSVNDINNFVEPRLNLRYIDNPLYEKIRIGYNLEGKFEEPYIAGISTDDFELGALKYK